MVELIKSDEALNKAIEEIKQIKENRKVSAFKLRFNSLNKLFGGGIRTKQIVIIGARPSVGKSAFANLLVYDIAKSELNPIINYWTFEMPAVNQMLRFISSIARIQYTNLLNKDYKFTDKEVKAIEIAKEKLSKLEINFIDVPARTTDVLTLVEKQYVENKDRPIVNVYDHSLLIRSSQKESKDKLYELFENCSYMVKKYETTEIVLNQINRKYVEDLQKSKVWFPATGDHLFGADAGKMYGNLVIILSRPELHDVETIKKNNQIISTENLVYVYVDKNRDGQIGSLLFKHNLEFYDFYEHGMS